MAEALVFQCCGWYDYKFEPGDYDSGHYRAQILLGTVIWESERGYYDEEVAEEAAVEHLRSKMKELLNG